MGELVELEVDGGVCVCVCVCVPCVGGGRWMRGRRGKWMRRRFSSFSLPGVATRKHGKGGNCHRRPDLRRRQLCFWLTPGALLYSHAGAMSSLLNSNPTCRLLLD